MVVDMPRPHMTVEEFAEIAEDGKFDLVDGEVWHAPPTEFAEAEVGTVLSTHLVEHVRRTGLGTVYGSRTGFRLPERKGTVVCPELAFVAASRVPPKGAAGFFPGSPDLAVMYVTPYETSRRLVAKQAMLMNAGTSLLWTVFPGNRAVLVYDAEVAPHILDLGDMLTGGSVLPGFALPLAMLFEE